MNDLTRKLDVMSRELLGVGLLPVGLLVLSAYATMGVVFFKDRPWLSALSATVWLGGSYAATRRIELPFLRASIGGISLVVLWIFASSGMALVLLTQWGVLPAGLFAQVS